MKKCPNCQFEQQYWDNHQQESHAPGCTNNGFIWREYYYTPPSDEAFEHIRLCAIMIWQSYDNTYGYASEKIESINDIKNVKDNYAYIFSMFDTNNQRALRSMLTNEEAKDKLDWLVKYEHYQLSKF